MAAGVRTRRGGSRILDFRRPTSIPPSGSAGTTPWRWPPGFRGGRGAGIACPPRRSGSTPRAGTETAFWWGATIGPDQANADFRAGFAGRPPAGVVRGGTCPVRSFAANPWGLWQTSGNVWEWCADGFSPQLAGLPGDGRPAAGRRPGLRALRGGSFLNGPWNLRSACRLGDPDGFRHVSFGVRLACDVAEDTSAGGDGGDGQLGTPEYAEPARARPASGFHAPGSVSRATLHRAAPNRGQITSGDTPPRRPLSHLPRASCPR